MNPTDVGQQLEGIKQKALTIQSSLANFKGQDLGTPNPQLNGINDSLTRNLSSAVASSGNQEQSIMQKFAERKTLAETAAESQKKLIQSQAGTEIDTATKAGEQTKTAELESRRGFATNTALIRQIEDTSKKRVLDLEKARDELLLKADVAKADRLDNLIVSEQEAVTQARRDYINNLQSLSSETRAQANEARSAASFETPDQKSIRELKSQFADVPGVLDATALPDMLKLIAPKVGQARALEIASKELDNRYKQAQIDKAKADVSDGLLTDAEVARIDKSPQGQKLSTLSSLTMSANRYKTLLDTYGGYEFGGIGKTLLEGAYADLQVRWKEAANLGALTGPDLDLIIDAVKPATGIRGLSTAVFGGGTAGIKSSIDALLANTKQEADQAYSQLVLRNSKYSSSEYVKGLYTPFKAINPNPATQNTSNRGLTSDSTPSSVGIDQGNLFYNLMNNGQ